MEHRCETDGGDVIELCEKILEALPHDTIALATLCEAYEQADDTQHATEYLIRLGKVILAERDADTAPSVITKLERVAKGNPLAEKTVNRLTALVRREMTTSQRLTLSSDAKARTPGITFELTLAWNLLQMEELSEDEYSRVVQDLSENAGQNVEAPVSVLHVLQDRGFKQLQRVVGRLAKESGLPLIALGGFELQEETYSLLPEVFMTRRGAIVFERMEEEILVAILNPYDEQLRNDVAVATGRKCHFYLTTAMEYDNALAAM